MALEIKFSLPGIALDEPDVYENNPSPRTLKNENPEDIPNEQIITQAIHPDLAYQKFKDEKLFTNDYNNFLEERYKSLVPPKGYISIEYDPENLAIETPAEKYARIQRDLADLQTQLNTMEIKDESDDKKIDVKGLINKLEDINNHIRQQQYGSIINNSLFASEGTLNNFKDLIEIVSSGDKIAFDTMDNFKSKLDTSELCDNKADILFELYCNKQPMADIFNKERVIEEMEGSYTEINLKISELTQRMNQITSLLGNDKLNEITIDEKNSSNDGLTLMDVVNITKTKVDLLGKLGEKELRNEIETYCKDLTVRYKEIFPTPPTTLNSNFSSGANSALLSSIATTTSAGTSSNLLLLEYQKNILKSSASTAKKELTGDEKTEDLKENMARGMKINKVYEMLRPVQTITNQLPDIYKKLNILQNIQKKGEDFLLSYEELTNTQNLIECTLRENKEIMEKLKSEFNENVKIIKSNCEMVEERIKKLNK